MGFDLKRQTGKVAHLNVREEKHGEESVVAVDVKVAVDVGNDFLDGLALGLRRSLYAADPEQLQGVEQPLSILRYPQLEPLDWNTPMKGCGFTLHGAKKADDLVFLADVTKSLRLQPKEGGTVAVTFQMQVRPSASEMGALSALLGRATKVTVKAGAAPETLELDAEDEKVPAEPAGKKGKLPKSNPFPRRGD